MNRLILACALVFFFVSGTVSANEKLIKAIEKRQNDCIEKDPTTAGMIKCADAAYKEWDREMNSAYKKLLSLLDEKEREDLKQSQRAWLKFRDLEFKNINNVYTKMDGTMYLPMHTESETRIVRERALQLIKYCELLSDGG